MRHDKNIAIKFRRQGKSYNEINKLLGIPKGTLASWFKNNKESQKIKLALSGKSNKVVAKRIRIFVKNNKERWEKIRSDARDEAKKEFKILSKNPLFVAGVMLYWAEGDSVLKNPLRFTNTSASMISLYVKFLINVLSIPKEDLRANIILYKDLADRKNIDFWSKTSTIPKNQFYKTQYIQGRHKTRRLINGICMIIYSKRIIKEKMIIWIDLLAKRL